MARPSAAGSGFTIGDHIAYRNVGSLDVAERWPVFGASGAIVATIPLGVTVWGYARPGRHTEPVAA